MLGHRVLRELKLQLFWTVVKKNTILNQQQQCIIVNSPTSRLDMMSFLVDWVYQVSNYKMCMFSGIPHTTRTFYSCMPDVRNLPEVTSRLIWTLNRVYTGNPCTHNIVWCIQNMCKTNYVRWSSGMSRMSAIIILRYSMKFLLYLILFSCTKLSLSLEPQLWLFW